jgi:hypothetical protein
MWQAGQLSIEPVRWTGNDNAGCSECLSYCPGSDHGALDLNIARTDAEEVEDAARFLASK